MKRVHYLFKKAHTISWSSKIHTGNALLLRDKQRLSRSLRNKPGLGISIDKHEEYDRGMKKEWDFDDEVDPMRMHETVAQNMNEYRKEELRIHNKIVKKKYFSSRPEPSTLTCNERKYIKYLHEKDPVQWDVKTLSESFPATVLGIKKVLKSKGKISPEKAKLLDSIVQKNWELLAEGKLDADPAVLEHLKKFTNRRAIHLEQIKNKKFYLPEENDRRIRKKGEMSSILHKYEEALKNLSAKTDYEQTKKLCAGTSEKEVDLNKTNSVDLFYKKIDIESKTRLKKNDSFIYGKINNASSQDTTLETLEDQILNKAEARKELHPAEKAILDNKLSVKSQTESNINEVDFLKSQEEKAKKFEDSVRSLYMTMYNKENHSNKINSTQIKKGKMERIEDSDRKLYMTLYDRENHNSKIHSTQLNEDRTEKIEDSRRKCHTTIYDKKEHDDQSEFKKLGEVKTIQIEDSDVKHYSSMNDWKNPFRVKESEDIQRMPDFCTEVQNPETYEESFSTRNDTKFIVGETEIWNELSKLQKNVEPSKAENPSENTIEKLEIKLSDPERIKREEIYYNRAVSDLKHTSFWNDRRNSQEKAMAEYQKPEVNVPASDTKSNFQSSFVFSTDAYPERIKVPKNKKGSGLTYRINDCYYDDDGEFLYRVPGMTNKK